MKVLLVNGSPHKEGCTYTAATVMSARRAGTTATWDQMNKYFGLMQMPIVTSRYWNMVHGATPEQVKEDVEGMQCMRFLAHNMAWLIRCKAAGKRPVLRSPSRRRLPSRILSDKYD